MSMTEAIDSYTNEEFNRQFTRIRKAMSFGYSPAQKPQAVLLGGQSGAGKTRLQRIIIDTRGDNFIIINGDEYRSLHPRFDEIQQQYGIDAPAHTAQWSGSMVEVLVDALSREGYNLIIEGTLRTSSVPLRTATLFRKRGYDVSLALMAVKPDISLVSCKIRYERMHIAGTTPRAVDPAHHARIVEDIVDNVAVHEQSELFDQISLFNRAGVCLFAGKCPMEDAAASQALSDVLFGDWTTEESAHHASLLDELALLTAEQPD